MKRFLLFALIFCVLFQGFSASAEEPNGPATASDMDSRAGLSVADDMGETIRREVGRVGEEFQYQAISLFERTPLGWDKDTLVSIYRFVLSLPMRIPEVMRQILSQGRALGLVGSILVLIFLGTALYAIMGQRRVMTWVEERIRPMERFMPEDTFPYCLSGLKVIVASLIPLILLGIYSLINASIQFTAGWYLLTGRLLWVWALGALILHLFHEVLTSGIYPAADQYGRLLYRRVRLVVLYIFGGVAVAWGAEAFSLERDITDFLNFAVYLSVVCVSLLLFFNKKAILSLLPELPYLNYRTFRCNLERYYPPVVYGTFITGLLWCFGYKRITEVLWTKTWAVAGVYIGFMVAFHLLQARLSKWSNKQIDRSGEKEEARIFFRYLRVLLQYVSVLFAAVIIANLLGISGPIVRLCSFSILMVGGTQVTLWLIIKAIIVFTVLMYLSMLIRSYLSFKVYPAIGVDTGLAYALNTFLKYLLFFVTFLATLWAIELSFQVFMVFAGAAGIGLGLGMQNMAANIISGLTIVFGRRVRRDDWIEVGDTMGAVTDIYLHSTKVITRDNIEYLIPNAQILSNMIVNYSLSSPTIRLSVPVGVSYQADPIRATEIFKEAAAKHPEISRYHDAEVRFVGYGDNSINFDVLIWIDIRKTARRNARSLLYYTIFEMLKNEGIEIPYPQRDIHIRSGSIGQPQG